MSKKELISSQIRKCVVIDDINEGNGVGTSTPSRITTSRPRRNVPKRLFLEMFHPQEPEVSDEISIPT